MKNLIKINWFSNEDYKTQFLKLYKNRLNKDENLSPLIKLNLSLRDYLGIQVFKLTCLILPLLFPFFFFFKVDIGNAISSGIISFGVLLLIIQFTPSFLPRFDYHLELKNSIRILLKSINDNSSLINYEIVDNSLSEDSEKNIRIELIRQYHNLVEKGVMVSDSKMNFNAYSKVLLGYYITDRTLLFHKSDEESLYLYCSMFHLGKSSLASNLSTIIPNMNKIYKASDCDNITKKELNDYYTYLGQLSIKLKTTLKYVEEDKSNIVQLCKKR